MESVAFPKTSSTITRPADMTAYAVGDLVANSTTAGSVTPFSFSIPTDMLSSSRADGLATFRLDRMRIKTSNTSTTNAVFAVHIYSSSPTVSNGDNGAFLSPSAGYEGVFDVTVDRAFTDAAIGVGLPRVGQGIICSVAAASTVTLYALVEARGAYTPASGQTFTLIAEGYRF